MSRVESILAKAGVPATGVQTIEAARDAVAVWEYDLAADEQSHKLYRQGRVAGWTADDLGFDDHLLPERLITPVRDLSRVPPSSPFSKFDAETWRQWDNENILFTLSQTMHGEHLGLLASAALCETADTWDVKLFAATQTADEARHLEAFQRYVALGGDPYPVNGHLHSLLSDVLASKSWDFIYIALQVMVEGMALGTLGWVAEETNDDRLRHMLRLVLADEARHVAFGVHAMQETLSDLTEAELALRVDFIDEVAHSLADRLVPVEVADKFGLDRNAFVSSVIVSPTFRRNQSRWLRHIAPICGRLGLLDLRNGQLRNSFETLGLFDQPHPHPVRRTLAS